VKQQLSAHAGMVFKRCKFCPEAFEKDETLAEHMQGSHSSNVELDNCALPSRMCPECGKIITAANPDYQLNIHLRKFHGKDSEHKCKLCEMNFASRSTLERHNVKNPECASYCEMCGKKSQESSVSRSHERSSELEAL